MSSEVLNSTIDGVLNTRLHIQNIPPHITDVHLRSLLGNAGYIKDICYFNKNKKQMNNFANKKIYNTALVTFNTHEEALNVMKNIKNLIDTNGEERIIEAKFAIPNINNNNFFQKNNVNISFPLNYQNNFNHEGFNSNINSYNFYSNNNNQHGNFMNRNMKNKNGNNMINMNMMNQINNPMMNQNNFMHNNNNNYNVNKNMNDVLREGELTPNNNNSGNTLFRKNNYQIYNNSNSNESINNNNNNNSENQLNNDASSTNHTNANINNNAYQNNENIMDEDEGAEGLSLWDVYKDKNNNTYYYNNLTKHSQWNKPIHPNKLFQYNNNEKIKQNGPNGSNLFIFHIPSEWTDLDLFQHFCCFGNIISSKIQRDNTGRNSGFGFVSYDNIMSAHHAIQIMNGYYVNNKYLKVQLKKGEAMEKAQS